MAHADWLVDLGPGAGHDGGQVVFTGTPADLVASGDSLTAQHLRAYLQED
jgi:excinuclease UvrABC ATPase subunit